MGWHRITKKIRKGFREGGQATLDFMTGGQSYMAREQMDAEKDAAKEMARIQEEANRQKEVFAIAQAGAPPSETISGSNLSLDEINKKSALRRTILSRQNASNKLGA